jgi:uncharacterized protein (TIGR02594 family)
LSAYPLPSDPRWLKAAFKDLGLHEIRGPRHNARVLEMFRIAGHDEIHDDETAWCSAAENTWMVESGIRGTGSLAARSWLAWGKKLDTSKTIPRGAVLIFRRGTSSYQGHVCTLLEDMGEFLKVIGGNQSDAVTVTTMRRAPLIGARWPDTAANSNTLRFGALSAASEAGEQAVGGAADQLQTNADGIADALGTAQSQVQEYAQYLTYGKYLLVALAIAGFALMVWRFYSKHLRPTPIPEIEAGPSIDDDIEEEEPAPRRRTVRKRVRR